MQTQTLTYIGETGTQAYDGYAGFIIGQQYEITYTEVVDDEDDEKSEKNKKQADEVLVQLPHAPGRTTRMKAADFKKWFRKS